MSLSDLCLSLMDDEIASKDSSDKNILEFTEAPWGLGLGCTSDVPPLYSAQRFILKSYYGLELDGSSKRDIIVRDRTNEIELYRFNEVEYANFLFDEGRINKKWDGTPTNYMVLVAGRRSGKSTVTSCIIAYETYRLLNKYCPQEYYGIMPEQNIRFTCISTSKDTAKELFDMVTGHIERCEFFRKHRMKSAAQWINLKTQRDIDKYGNRGRASISIRVAPCSAKGLRGPNNMIVVLDEMAHFFADEKSKGLSRKDRDDRAIYTAVTPSVAKFKRKDGTPEGKVICISSPGPKTGKFYEEYERSFEDEQNDLFMLQAPTWEIDPGISSQYLKQKYRENPITFKGEFGAQFSDQLFGWIEDPSIVRQNIVYGLKYKEKSSMMIPHFMGVDVAFKNDGAAITIGHWASEIVNGQKIDKLEVDLSEVRFAEKEGKDYFIPEDIIEWIADLCKRFNISKGMLDQFYEMSFIPQLHKMGYRQFECKQFNDQLNSTYYQVLLTAFISSSLRFPDGDHASSDGFYEDKEGHRVYDSELVAQLLKLQAEQRTKYLINVHAPERAGEHDDLADSLARMVYLAYENKGKGMSHSLTSAVLSQTIRSIRAYRYTERAKADLNRPSSRYMRNSTARGGVGRSMFR